ncbi:MAG TPA: tail fiber domain-containing protein, partial [Dongiaceae bacterium]|nr:tail fiber domain-containing protein [Dongiaceae bacterium]
NGGSALQNSDEGSFNTANGFDALFSNTSGSYNTANGVGALENLTSGSRNTADGSGALDSLTDGDENIALGRGAGFYLTTGSYNIYIGNSDGTAESGIIRIGSGGAQTNTFIAGIYDATAAGGSAVYVDANGQLGTRTSSRRYKEDIRSMGDASDVLLSLRPVTFRYKPEIDPKGLPQFGLVAEEVDQVDPDLVVRDQRHGIYTVRYETVNAMLLNEFQKEHSKVEQQKSEIQTLKEKAAKVDSLEKRVGELEEAVRSLAERR